MLSKLLVRVNKYIRITDFDDFGIEADHVFMTAENYSAKHELQKNEDVYKRQL